MAPNYIPRGLFQSKDKSRSCDNLISTTEISYTTSLHWNRTLMSIATVDPDFCKTLCWFSCNVFLPEPHRAPVFTHTQHGYQHCPMTHSDTTTHRLQGAGLIWMGQRLIDPWGVQMKPYISNFKIHIKATIFWTFHVKFPSDKCHKTSRIISQHMVQVMAWCHQAPSHYLNQSWPNLFMKYPVTRPQWVKTFRPEQNCQHFADVIFKCVFLDEAVWISIKISLKFVPKCMKWVTDNNSASVQVMA